VLFPTDEEEQHGIGQYPLDIWAVACIAIFMLTKQPPFPKPRDLSDFSIGKGHLDEDSWGVSDGGKKMILWMLKRDPRERPSAKEAMESEWIAPDRVDAT
jgi:serine/threonine protein kinase